MDGTLGGGAGTTGALSRLLEVPMRVARPENQFQLAAKLTLVVLLLHSGVGGPTDIPIKLLVVVGFLWADVVLDWMYWLIALFFLVYGNAPMWDLIDNHYYLITYWVASIVCILVSGSLDLSWNARALIALTMLAAAFHKLLSPDYMSGEMFQHHLLLDGRFRGAAAVLTGLQLEDLEWNAHAWQAFVQSSSRADELWLRGAEEVGLLGLALTWWGVLIELVIGACFLLPQRKVFMAIGNVSLLIFIVTTYFIASVVGFGWILAVLGIAQCRPSQTRFRFAYLLSLFAVAVFPLV